MTKKKYIALLLLLLIFCASCDRMIRDMMHDAPKEANQDIDNSQDLYFKGKALFQVNCATCHNYIKDATGPALQGSFLRWNRDTARLKAFIRNSKLVIRGGDKYAIQLFKKWDRTEMTAFPNLTDKELNALLQYMK